MFVFCFFYIIINVTIDSFAIFFICAMSTVFSHSVIIKFVVKENEVLGLRVILLRIGALFESCVLPLNEK